MYPFPQIVLMMSGAPAAASLLRILQMKTSMTFVSGSSEPSYKCDMKSSYVIARPFRSNRSFRTANSFPVSRTCTPFTSTSIARGSS